MSKLMQRFTYLGPYFKSGRRGFAAAGAAALPNDDYPGSEDPSYVAKAMCAG